MYASNDESDTLLVAEQWLREGRQTALATVIETWGSAPRRIGSQMIIDAQGVFLGSVSGGCVETEVITAAADVIATGEPKLLEFGVADETAWRVGLSCGGRIRVSVECPDKELLYRLNQERSARRTALVISDLNQGHQRLIRENDDVEDDLRDEATTALRNGVSRILEVGEKTYFLNVFRPKPRLVIIGAVHISQALAPMAHMVGYDVEIIDPRTAFASPERFPASRIYPDWPQDILTKRPLDRHTALAALTHDPRIDDWALAAALEAGCFYVGALGSRKTHAQRLQRLAALGTKQPDLDRIAAPIGLNIGAATPSEIAVAVLAEIIRSFRFPKAEA
ncbi:xanthine dehydrogenase accessory factor [Ochrobactrum daejeonense]|uniref:Xanthine dehydrogenase accessory factor n=1 Tax=Brucella daejeonensis TaxID=659015 RepID=A0A7W9EN10_9HYPH|nr:XdhC family protein [Brucella daejeonensis]MBB5703949.1 xanthine dehydrogenase accessory factor [Brucella daejeonensis]